MSLNEITLVPIRSCQEIQFQSLMSKYHYLGSLPKIGNTLRYIACWGDKWIALLNFSASALKCTDRDTWIGWNFHNQFDRLHLIANNSRLLILPDYHIPNLGSRILSLCEKRVVQDWHKKFGYPLLLLETFVDPKFFKGTIYRAANWQCVGTTKGFRRFRDGYQNTCNSRKLIFVRALLPDARTILSSPNLKKYYHHGGCKKMLNANQMRALPECFKGISDPRRGQGRRHPLHVVLAISAAAILCGARGYKAISLWANDLGSKARARFGCRCIDGQYIVPSRTTIRDVLIRVGPNELNEALRGWNMQFAYEDEGMALDGKTMKNAIDDEDNQTHILGLVGHQTNRCYSQEKIGSLPVEGTEETKKTNEIGMCIPFLQDLDIQGKTITADALLTQRKIANYIVDKKGAHFVFVLKENQSNLLKDVQLVFKDAGEPDYREPTSVEHGRIEDRAIWVSEELNEYLDFPHVGQVFCIERKTINKKTGKKFTEVVYGVTSHTSETASPERLLKFNREHWIVESIHYILDWNWDQDRCTIRTGHGPENISNLQRLACTLIKSKSKDYVAATISKLARNVRIVFDYLGMTKNSMPKFQKA